MDYFTAQAVPGLSLRDYCTRIVEYSQCTPECFLFALAYIRRAAAKGFPISELTVHRLLITAVVVAVKVRDDRRYKLVHYARIGGVDVGDLCTMELQFLMNIIDFRADVSVDEYFATCTDLSASGMPASFAAALPVAAPTIRSNRKQSCHDIASCDDSDLGLSSSSLNLGRTTSAVDSCSRRMQYTLEWTRELRMYCPTRPVELLSFDDY
jgi:hypothetical protein